MVGVPGRSNACHNCKQRKMRCGGERPGCHNCARSHRLCLGYQRKCAFILSRAMVTGEPDSSGDELSRLTDEADSGAVFVSRWKTDPNKPSPSTSSTMPIIQAVSQHNMFREKFLGLYLEHHRPTDTMETSAPWFKQLTWLFHVAELPAMTPALEYAVLAVCTAQLGRGNNHQALVHESLSLYTRGLRELRRAVLNPATRTNEQNISTCLALLMYEVIECPGKVMDGYFSHYSGAMKLLQLRGAGAHSSGLAHSVFRTLRIHSVYEGFRMRSKTFLADPQWCDLPWSSCPTSKNPHDEVVDLILEIPTVYARTDNFEVATNEQDILTGAIRIVRECLRLDAGLTCWLARFEASMVGPLYYPELSRIRCSADSPELGKVFPVRFSFPAPIVAHAMILYWLGLIIIRSHICLMYDKLIELESRLDPIRREVPCTCGGADINEEEDEEEEKEEEVKGLGPRPVPNARLTAPRFTCLRHFSMDILPPLGSKSEWSRTSTRNICQSAEYFLQDTVPGVGSVSVLPALVTVKAYYRFVPGCGRQIAWIDDVLTLIREKGNAIAAHIIF